MAITTIVVNDKYTVIHENGTGLRAIRYGCVYRDLIGDGLILAMAQRIEDLEEINDHLRQSQKE